MYHVGEIVLLEWHGWLKAFRVVGVHQVDEEHVSYDLRMLDHPAEKPA